MHLHKELAMQNMCLKTFLLSYQSYGARPLARYDGKQRTEENKELLVVSIVPVKKVPNCSFAWLHIFSSSHRQMNPWESLMDDNQNCNT